MLEKERKKAVKELKKKIIPKIKVRNLAHNPDKNLKGQGVYRANAIFTMFDYETGKELERKINELLEFGRAGTRQEHTMNVANDIVNFITLKTEEMDQYRVRPESKTKHQKRGFLYYLTEHPIWASIIILIMLLGSILAILSYF